MTMFYYRLPTFILAWGTVPAAAVRADAFPVRPAHYSIAL